MNASERMAELFDAVAEIYENRAAIVGHFASAWMPRHIQDIENLDECEVLDLGCGPGLNVKLLTQQRTGIRADGVDVSPKMLEQARASNCYRRLYAHDLAKPMPYFASESFDLVIVFAILELLTDIGVCLSECHRVLKSNGTLWASFRRFEAEDEGSPPRHITAQGSHYTGYSTGEILHMVKRAGMYVISIEPVTGYITHNGFSCPYLIVRARKTFMSGSGVDLEPRGV